MRGQILRGDDILTLTVTFSRVMCVSTVADVSPALSVEQSAMIFRRGRGHDHVVILENVAHLEEVNPMVAGRVALIRGSSNISIAEGIIISLRSVGEV